MLSNTNIEVANMSIGRRMAACHENIPSSRRNIIDMKSKEDGMQYGDARLLLELIFQAMTRIYRNAAIGVVLSNHRADVPSTSI